MQPGGERLQHWLHQIQDQRHGDRHGAVWDHQTSVHRRVTQTTAAADFFHLIGCCSNEQDRELNLLAANAPNLIHNNGAVTRWPLDPKWRCRYRYNNLVNFYCDQPENVSVNCCSLQKYNNQENMQRTRHDFKAASCKHPVNESSNLQKRPCKTHSRIFFHFKYRKCSKNIPIVILKGKKAAEKHYKHQKHFVGVCL